MGLQEERIALGNAMHCAGRFGSGERRDRHGSRAITLAELLVRLGSRAEVEYLIQGMIDALDDLDGDCDLEPSLGSFGGTSADCGFDQSR